MGNIRLNEPIGGAARAHGLAALQSCAKDGGIGGGKKSLL